MSRSRRFCSMIAYMLLFAVSALQAEMITGETFEQWGKETLSVIESTFGRSDGLYGHKVNENWADFAWGQGIMFGANVAAAKIDPSYIPKAEKQALEIYSTYRCYYKGYWGLNASRYNCGDRYYDDNAWIAYASLEMHDILKDSDGYHDEYLDWAREILIFCMSGENSPDSTPDGGISWHENKEKVASVCATAPTIVSNLLVYKYTGIQSYLDDGLRLYNWLINSNLRYDRWIFHENNEGPLGYQTSVIAKAAVLLFEFTGEEEFLLQAQTMASSMEGEFINPYTGALNQHGKWGGHDMTNAYVDLYHVDGNTYWLDVAARYLEFLYINCIDPESGLYPEVWNNTTSGDYSAGLIDTASVARSFLTMALTEGGRTLNNTFASNLIGHWTFDEQSGTTAADGGVGGSDGTLSGSSFSFDNSSVAGIRGNALYFDGTDDYIDLPNGFANFKTGMTISLWAYPTAVKSWARFVDMGNGPGDYNFVFARRSTSNDLIMDIVDSTGVSRRVMASGVIELNKWQLFTVTVDNSGVAFIYKNGNPVATGTLPLPVNIERFNNLIGRSNWDSDAYYQGSIDDVRIYNYALNSQDVLNLYHYGSQAEHPSPNTNSKDVSDSVSLSWSGNADAVSHDVYLGTDYDSVLNATTDSLEYKGRQSSQVYAPELLPATNYYWRIDGVASSSEVSKGLVWSFTTAELPLRDLMVYYNMEQEFVDGHTLIDASQGNVLSGNLVGPSIVNDAFLADVLYLDGGSDYVELPEGFSDFSNGMTFSFWAHPTEVRDWSRFIDFGNGAASNNIVLARNGTSNTLSFEVYNGSSGGGKIQASGAIEQDTWQMFTAVINSDGFGRLYKNGVTVAKGRTAAPQPVTRENNYIGKSNWSNPYFIGGIDDFAVWDRLLSPTEIQNIYNRAVGGKPLSDGRDPYMPVAYWKFNEATGSYVADNTENDYHGTLYNAESDNWTAGKQCTGVVFDGVDEYMEIGSFKGIPGSASRTVCAWIKTSEPSFTIANWGEEAPNAKWNVQLAPNGVLGVSVNGGHIIGSTDLADDQWHHIAIVLNNDGSPNINEVLLYIDGRKDQVSNSYSCAVNTAVSENVKFGVDILKSDYTMGAIDEVMIFSRALSGNDIEQIYKEYVLAGDFGQDGVVDLQDFSVIAYNWNIGDKCDIDLTCDCQVDIDDLMILVDQWLAY